MSGVGRRLAQVAAAAVLVVAAAIVALVVVTSATGGRSVSESTGTTPAPAHRSTVARHVPSAAERTRAAQDAGIDRVLRRTPYVVAGGGEKRELSLTFDDGPGPYTPHVLDVLRRLHAPATFFTIGFMIPLFHQALRREVGMGTDAAIGDHTEQHPMMTHLSPAAQQSQIEVQTEQLHRFGGSFPRLYRPPYGLANAATLRILRRNHMLMVLWSADTEDYTQPGVRAIVRAALAGARPGAIILMHDAGGTRTQTIAALPAIVSTLRKRGYKLVTVPQLMTDDPPRHVPRALPRLTGG